MSERLTEAQLARWRQCFMAGHSYVEQADLLEEAFPALSLEVENLQAEVRRLQGECERLCVIFAYARTVNRIDLFSLEQVMSAQEAMALWRSADERGRAAVERAKEGK